MAKRYTAPSRPSMSQADQARHRRAQARERERRGLSAFTRPELRESVLGETPGESQYSAGVRGMQVGYPRKRKR